MFFLLFACSGKLELDELDPVDMNTTQILIPAPGATLIDSVKAAFVKSICPGSTNDKGHEQMVYDTQYHRWIMKTFGCSANEAKWLSYVGTENTIVYERLSDSEKEKVAACVEKYNIKHEKKS